MNLNLKPSPAMAVAVVALISSLGTGGAYAATQLAKDSVGTKQIRNGSVTMSDLNKSARPSKNSKLFRTAVAETVSTDQVLTALKDAVKGGPGEKGAPGPAGAQGATGATGATGAQGLPGAVIVPPQSHSSRTVTVGAGGVENIIADCPPNMTSIGGVGTSYGSGRISNSEKSGDGWLVTLSSTGGQASGMATVFCAVK